MQAYEHSLRQEVVDRYEAGERQVDISRDLGISYSTVLGWLKRYKAEGLQGLCLRYDRCGGSHRVSQFIKDKCVEMKAEHPTWGGAYIRMKLCKAYPDHDVPSARQLQRYFQAAGLVELQTRLPRARGSGDWAKRPLYRVQVDAKEQIKTEDGNWCSYLTFTDEHSGATLEGLVFPLSVYPTNNSR